MKGIILKSNVITSATTVLTDYCGNMIYEGGALKQILVDGGYVTLNGTTPVYHYYLQDHLGNNRVVCNASSTVEQVNHYYPFGGLFGQSTNGDTQRYKYNCKELDRMHGLDWYDYGARHMDAMRFTTMDPMAEKYYNMSPYAYCGNNPIRMINSSQEIGASLKFEFGTINHQTVENSNGSKNLLTTSHEENAESGLKSYLFDNKAYVIKLNRFDHNHPSFNTQPSFSIDDYGNMAGDMGLVFHYEDFYPNNHIKFNIYTLNNGSWKYFNYNSATIIQNGTNNNYLPKVIIHGQR